MAWSPHLGQFGQFGQNWGANLVFFALVPPYLFEDLERHRERAATCNPFLGDDFYCSSTIIAYKYWHVVTYSDIFILSYNMIVNMPKLTDVVLWLQDAASIKMLGAAWRCKGWCVVFEETTIPREAHDLKKRNILCWRSLDIMFFEHFPVQYIVHIFHPCFDIWLGKNLPIHPVVFS